MTCVAMLALAVAARSQAGFDWLYDCDQASGTIGRWNPAGGAPESVVSGLDDPIDLVVDHKHCKLYWISDGDNTIQQADLDGSNVSTVLTSPEPRGLALDPENRHLYFMDRTLHEIRRHDLLAGTTITIRQMDLIPDCYIPLSIAIDIEGGWIYWTDPCQQTVSRVKLYGGSFQVLHVNQTDVRGIALDLDAGKIYWVTFTQIQCSNLDGSGTTTLVDLTATGAIQPNLIALDTIAGRMYWTQLGSIECADLDGSNIMTTLAVPEPSGLALVEEVDESFDWLYYVDTMLEAAGRWEPPMGSPEVVVSDLSKPIDLVVDRDRCSLYWISDGTNQVMRSNIDGSAATPLADSTEPRGLALDSGEGCLFFMDRQDYVIRRYDLETGDVTTVHGTGAGGIPLTLVLDVDAQQIYWSDPSLGTIQRVGYDGVGRTTIVSGLTGLDLRGIALDLDAGKLYWVTFVSISRSDLDGANQEQLVDLTVLGSANPNLIALDLCKGRMYWTEFGAIRRADLDGGNIMDVVLTPKPSGLVLVDGPVNVPWTVLDGGTVGIDGVPELAGFGSLEAGSQARLKLIHAPPGALVLLWIAVESNPLSALGGTVHAVPFLEQLFFDVPSSGELLGSTTWPTGIPACTDIWFQFLIADPSSIHGITLSNGLRATTP